MSTDENAFRSMIREVRMGNEEAAAALVQQFEPAIRRVVRMRLTDPRLRRVFDSMDVCQSVLANFFVRVGAGEFDLEEPEQLLRLLATLARNRLVDHVRQQQAARRDNRRVQAGPDALDAVPAHETTPSQIVSGKELLQRAYGLFSEEERFLAEQRGQGREWAEIAAQVGGTPDGLRVKLARAMSRVAPQLGLDSVPHE